MLSRPATLNTIGAALGWDSAARRCWPGSGRPCGKTWLGGPSRASQMIAERLEEIAAKAESAGREAEGPGPLAASHPVGRHHPGGRPRRVGHLHRRGLRRDGLAGRPQEAIETKLAAKHLAPEVNPGRISLVDLSSWWVTGRCCPLASRGYCRDGGKGPAADRVRGAHRSQGPSGRGAGVGGQHRRSERVHGHRRPDPRHIRATATGAGRRPRHDRLRASPRCVNSTTVERISGGSPRCAPPRSPHGPPPTGRCR